MNDINILAYLSSSFISGFLQFVHGWSIEEGFVQLESFSFFSKSFAGKSFHSGLTDRMMLLDNKDSSNGEIQ